MPIFIAALLGGLVSAVGSITGRVLIALGFSFVMYQGVDVLLGWVKTQTMLNLMGLPGLTRQVVGMLKVDVAFSIITSAYATRLLVAGLASGTVKRMVQK